MARPATLAPIEPDKAYPLETFQDATGLGRAALATARHNGLIARKVGNRKFILGGDFIDYLKTYGKVESGR